MSDLHLEFGPLTLPGGDTLMLAGDVCVADMLRPERTDKSARVHRARYSQFFFEECAKYNRVFYVMGNHEHYSGVFDHTADILREFLQGSNVRLLDDEFVDLDDNTRLFGGTFWTDYDKKDYFCMRAAKTNMNDHRVIKKLVASSQKTFLFHPEDAVEEHYRSLQKLKDGLVSEKRTVVMTHHAPHFYSIAEEYKNSNTNGAYYSDQEKLMLDHPHIVAWLHGHVHDSFDYMVGSCNVLCNPRGYFGHDLNESFDANKLAVVGA